MALPPLVGRFMGLGIAAAMLAPILLFGYVSRETILGALREREDQDRIRSATVAASVVQEGLRAAGSDLRSIAGRELLREAMRAGDARAVWRHLADLRNASPRYHSAAAFDARGTMLAREPIDDAVGASFADSERFQGAMRSPGAYVSDPYISEADGAPVIAVLLRVGSESATLGVLQVAFAPEDLFAFVHGLRGVEGREVLIVHARSSRVIASGSMRAPLSTIEIPRAANAATARARVGGVDRVITYVPVGNADWIVYTLDDPAVALAVEDSLAATMTVWFVAIVAVILSFGLAGSWLWMQRAHAAQEVAKALETQRLANDRLREIDKRKDEFVSIVSHEFRTPLTGILGFSEMIRDEGLSADEMREFAGDIHKDAKRLARMINDMLDLDRMQSGRMELEMGSLDLNALVREVADLVAATAPGHRIDVRVDERIRPLDADRDKLTQVLTNLLNNAVKYSPDGGRIALVTELRDDEVRVSVTDSGIGIPADQLDRVFEKFTRVESKTVRDIQGTGLGLPIVRRIVEMHGGRVWAESELGKGATFHVSLPLVATPAEEPAGAPA